MNITVFPFQLYLNQDTIARINSVSCLSAQAQHCHMETTTTGQSQFKKKSFYQVSPVFSLGKIIIINKFPVSKIRSEMKNTARSSGCTTLLLQLN